jgi:hypothetical protein
MSTWKFVVSLALGLSISTAAMAETYQYTGGLFDLVSGSYTTSDRVSGTLTLSVPLIPNSPFGGLPSGDVVTDFSFTDGVQTVTDLNAVMDIFQIEGTDAAGLPTHWSIRIHPNSCPSGVHGTCEIVAFNDEIKLDSGVFDASDVGDGSPGTFADITPAATPLPATLPLLAGGLGIIGMLGARNRRKARTA